jgi:hypothetical protein
VKSKNIWRLLLALLAGGSLLMIGCGVAPTQTTSPLPTPSKVNTPTPPQPQEAPSAEPTEVEEETVDDIQNPQTAGLIEKARADLSSRLQIEAGHINLESVEAVQWRDSSLGCARPGRSYLTVITPGYLIMLEANGQVYEYHTSENHIVHCDDTAPPLDREVKPEAPLIEATRTDLAQRLNIAADQIQVRSVEARQWPDGSLGCPQPGMMYAQVISPGFQIILSAEGQEYDYRTDLQRVLLCAP